jgi:hypothetical protein
LIAKNTCRHRQSGSGSNAVDVSDSVPVDKLEVLVKKYITTALRIFIFLLDWS